MPWSKCALCGRDPPNHASEAGQAQGWASSPRRAQQGSRMPGAACSTARRRPKPAHQTPGGCAARPSHATHAARRARAGRGGRLGSQMAVTSFAVSGVGQSRVALSSQSTGIGSHGYLRPGRAPRYCRQAAAPPACSSPQQWAAAWTPGAHGPGMHSAARTPEQRQSVGRLLWERWKHLAGSSRGSVPSMRWCPYTAPPPC